MIISRSIFSVASQGAKTATIVLKQCNNVNTLLSKSATATATVNWLSMRTYTVNQLTKNLELITLDKDVTLEKTSTGVKVIQKESKPLVVILPWLMAKQPHIMKYANFYIDQGFDVLTVHLSPWQVLWPVKGSQVVAEELLEFLHANYAYEPLFLHGFSVGGYLWGEVCVKLNEQKDAVSKPLLDRFVGQIWDSAADITELPVGFPRAVFPRNKLIQNAAGAYVKYHLRTFHDVATCHYIRSSQMFHTNLVKAPALFLLSKTDPIGTEESNKRVHDTWKARGVQTYWKCWDKSPHVGHYRKHPKEYTAELYSFLDRLSLVQYPEKLRAKL